MHATALQPFPLIHHAWDTSIRPQWMISTEVAEEQIELCRISVKRNIYSKFKVIHLSVRV
jgi:hypothetical protein